MHSIIELPRPSLLVSVRSSKEAADAVAGGVDILDVKEPSAGSLGAAAAAVCCEVATVVGNQLPWTMACGELADGADKLHAHLAMTWTCLEAASDAGQLAPLPVAVKVGLAGCAGTIWRHDLEAVAASLPAGVRQVLVIYADAANCGAPAPDEVLDAAGDLAAAGVLVDTYDKQAAGLLGLRRVAELQDWQQRASAAGCAFAVAGKLKIEEFPALQPVNADIIAVRSAVCSQERTGPVEPMRVRQARQALVRSPVSVSSFSIDRFVPEKRSR